MTTENRDLADQSCQPCRGGVDPMALDQAEAMLTQLASGWALNPAGHLARTYTFDDFADALAFANAVGAIAEEQAHHPDLLVAWGRCGIEIWTHKIGGLADADFILAAKADRAFQHAD
jgi:4a-hydroxytetrahydrobiopterin dehydratase